MFSAAIAMDLFLSNLVYERSNTFAASSFLFTAGYLTIIKVRDDPLLSFRKPLFFFRVLFRLSDVSLRIASFHILMATFDSISIFLAFILVECAIYAWFHGYVFFISFFLSFFFVKLISYIKIMHSTWYNIDEFLVYTPVTSSLRHLKGFPAYLRVLEHLLCPFFLLWKRPYTYTHYTIRSDELELGWRELYPTRWSSVLYYVDPSISIFAIWFAVVGIFLFSHTFRPSLP